MGMNGPNDLDDGWAELARELGLEGDRPSPAPARSPDLHPPEDAAPPADDEEFVEEPGEAPTDADVYAASEADADGDADEADSDDEDADGEADGEGESTGEPGEPKKKRRRRRRRKKKPTDGTPAAAPVGSESPEESDEPAELEDAEEAAPADDGLVEEEGATPAATRELIANWDVPSWETIVNTMLFRPQGR
jgi:hypothetical protein